MSQSLTDVGAVGRWLNLAVQHPVTWMSGPTRLRPVTTMHMLQRLAGLVFLAALSGAALAATPAERLAADHAAWESAHRGYEERIAAGTLDAAERRDYEAFLDDLARRVLDGCAELQSLGQSIPDGVACPASSALVGEGGGEATQPAASGGTDRAALDAELGASLGEFDELLLREQDRVRAARPRVDSRDAQAASSAAAGRDGRSAASSGGGQGGDAASGDGTQGASGGAQGTTTASRGTAADQGAAGGLPGGTGGAQGGSQGSDGQGDPGQGGLGGSAGSGTAATPPADLPDPSGDDVVARQLREAAEAERDPELRTRLWDEYRRYRSGIN